MKPFQERVVTERNELDERIKRLIEFVDGSQFFQLPADERSRMRAQLATMKVYSRILGERIENFEC